MLLLSRFICDLVCVVFAETVDGEETYQGAPC